MAQIVKLRRSSVSGQKPTNTNLQLGELAQNTTDGKIFLAKSGSSGPSIEEIIVTNTSNTGSINLLGSVTASNFTGSFIGDGALLYNVPVSGVTNLTTISGSLDSRLDALEAYSGSQQVPTASYAFRTTQVDVYCKNMSGTQINKGTVVRITGAVGDNPLISVASLLTEGQSANTLGITTENIPNDGFGLVITEGVLTGVNTDGMTAGQLLFLGENGTFTTSYPVAPNHGVRLGEVLRVQQQEGSIYVRIDNGSELGEAHDVLDSTTSSSYGDLLVKSGSVWINSKNLNGDYNVTGSLTISENLTVLGSSSIVYVTSSQLDIATNIIKVNASNPSLRFGGLAVIDSGSSPEVSGSLLFDSVKDEWIFVHQAIVGSPTTSSIFLLGPETYGDLGNETYLTQNRIPKGSGIEHLYDSNITDTGTKVSINSNTEITGSLITTGTIVSETTPLVSGSSQINITGTDGYTTFSSSVKDRIDVVTGSITDLSSSVKDRIDIVTGSITDLSSSVKDRIDIVTGSITDLSSSVKDRIDVVTGSITDLSSSVKDRIDVVTGSITDLSSSVKDRIDTVTSSITDLSSSVKDRIDVVTGSVDSLNLFTSSYTTNSFTGSFIGDGSGLYNIPASGVTGLQLDKIINGNASASINNSGFYVNRDVFVDGTITAKEIHIDYVTSSVLYQSGSTKFGDSNDDTHQFTGSVKISGSLQSDSITGSFTGSFAGNASGLVNVPFHISGSDVDGGTYDKQFSKLQFDDSTGLNVSESVAGTAFISIGSHFRDIFVSGSDMLRATGSDAFEIIPEGGIEVTTSITDTNSNGYVKELRLSTTTLSSSLDTRIDNLSSSVVYQSETSSMTVLSSSYALTASFALNAGGGSEGRTYIHTQPSASTTWTVTHNLGEQYPAIVVFDSSDNVIVPGTITAVNDTSFTVTFPSAQTGKVSATVGGGLPFVSASFVDYVLAVNNDIPYWKGGVISGSAQIILTGTTGYSTFSSSVATTTLNIKNRVDSIEVKTGSYATTGSNLFIGTQTLSGSIIPSVDNLYDLGSSTHQWRDVYISSGSLYIDGTKVISSTTQELQITTDSGQSIKILENGTDSIILQTVDGDVELKSSGDGDILLDPTNGKIMLKGPVEILNGQKIQSSVGGTPVVFANDIVVSGSIDVTGTIDGIDLTSFSSSANTRLTNLESSGGSLNSFTASANTRLGTLETESGSIRTAFNSYTSSANSRLNSIETSTGSLNTFSSSTTTRLTAIETSTSSLNTFSSSTTTRLTAIETSTSSLNSYTSSTNTRLTAIETSTGSLNSYTSSNNTIIGTLQTATGSLNSFSSSTNTRLGELETESGSIRTAFNSYTSSNDGTNTTQNNRLTALETSTSSLNSFSSSTNSKLTSIETSTGSLNTFSSSTNTRVGALETESGSIRTAFNNYTSSNDGTNTTQNSRLTSLEGKTGSYATTGSNTFIGDQTITGSLFISQNLIVGGSSSINFVSQSTLNIGTNLITVNAQNPGTRFGGLAVIDSGSSPTVSGSMLFDSINDQWIFVHQAIAGSPTTSSVVLMGPESFNSLGSEIYPTTNRVVKSIDSEHLGDSNISDTGTKVSINSNTEITGTFVATGTALVSGSAQISFNGITDKPTLVSGSSQITFLSISSIPSGLVSGSSQVLNGSGVWSGSAQLPSGVVSGSSQVLNGSGVWSGSAQLPAGVVSGSSQITYSSISSIPSGIVSGSAQVISLLPSGTVSGSSQVLAGTTIHSGAFFNGISVVSGSGQISFNGITDKPALVSGSSQITFGSLTGLPSGLVSGSSQITFLSISSIPSGLVSGSSQVSFSSLNGLPSGIVSGSSQISFGSISGIPSGLVSGSSQVSYGSLSGIPSGIVSGSSQISFGSISNIPSGLVSGSSQITFSGISSKPTTISGYGITDAITTGNISSQTVASAGNSTTVGGLTPIQFFNNMGDNHSTRTSFDASTPSYGFGFRFIQGNTNGPATGGGGQFYSWYIGLGNDYPATGGGSYGMHVAIPRSATTPYMSIRYNESNSLGSWIKIAAGYADTAGSATSATTAGSLTSMNISQFTNNSGYITGISFANVSSKPTTISGYGITDAITTGNIGSQSVSYASSAGSAPNGTNQNSVYNVTPGEGNGLKFWSEDSYKISMGVSSAYQYGTVTDYSIKTQMNSGDAGRGFTWGRIGVVPIASLNATSGNMQLAGSLTTGGSILPLSNNSVNLGSASLGWANVYTNDLHLSNMNKPEGNDIDGTNGNWTIQEGSENLYIINNNNGKKYKISLEEI